MPNSIFLDNNLMVFTSLVQEFREDLSDQIGMLQIGAIGLSYLIAWIFAKKMSGP